eukprot:602244_1
MTSSVSKIHSIFHYNTTNKKYNSTNGNHQSYHKQKLQTLCRSRINHLYVSCIGKEQDIVHLPTLRNIRLTDMGSIKYTTLFMDNLLRKYDDELPLQLHVFSVRNMDLIMYQDEMEDNMYSIYRFIAFMLPQFWRYHPTKVFEQTGALLDATDKSQCMRYNVLELIRIDDGDCDTVPYNELLELFNDKHAVQCILNKKMNGFVSFGSANNTLCNALSNTIINVLSLQLYSLHLWSGDDDFSFTVQSNTDVNYYNLSELCMELISDASFDLLKAICMTAKLRMVHFEVNMHSVWFDECEAFVDCISRQLFVHESLHWIEIEMKDRASDIVNVYDVFHKTFKVRDCMGRKGKLVLKIKVLVTDDQFNANIEAHASHIGQLFNSLIGDSVKHDVDAIYHYTHAVQHCFSQWPGYCNVSIIKT